MMYFNLFWDKRNYNIYMVAILKLQEPFTKIKQFPKSSKIPASAMDSRKIVAIPWNWEVAVDSNHRIIHLRNSFKIMLLIPRFPQTILRGLGKRIVPASNVFIFLSLSAKNELELSLVVSIRRTHLQ